MQQWITLFYQLVETEVQRIHNNRRNASCNGWRASEILLQEKTPPGRPGCANSLMLLRQLLKDQNVDNRHYADLSPK